MLDVSLLRHLFTQSHICVKVPVNGKDIAQDQFNRLQGVSWQRSRWRALQKFQDFMGIFLDLHLPLNDKWFITKTFHSTFISYLFDHFFLIFFSCTWSQYLEDTEANKETNHQQMWTFFKEDFKLDQLALYRVTKVRFSELIMSCMGVYQGGYGGVSCCVK